MLTHDQVIPFLAHPEADLRELAIDYLGGCWAREPEILPTLFEARERFGDMPYSRNLALAKRFVVTDASFDQILAVLDREGSAGTVVRDSLYRLIANTPREILQKHWEKLESNPSIEDSFLAELRFRIHCYSQSDEDLWELLQKYAKEADQANESGDEESDDAPEWSVEPSTIDAIIDALATREFPDTDTIRQLLHELDSKDQTLEIYLTALAGRRRIKEAIPILLPKLHDDENDVLAEEIIEAVARIGDNSAVELIREEYPTADVAYRFRATSLLGKLKCPESEAAILELLNSETDSEIRTFLCVSLCELISDRSVEVVRQEIANGSEMAFTEVSPMALAVAGMLGQELPRMATQWRRERDRQNAALKQAEALWLGLSSTPEAISNQATEESEEKEETDHPRRKPKAEPIRKQGTRTGRNDPCPCGSGKKYKKCCGGSSR